MTEKLPAPYFLTESATLYEGDALALMDELPEESVEMAFADPPYLLSNGGITCQSGKMVSVDKGEWDVSKGVDADFEWNMQWLSEVQRLLAPNGTLWVSGTSHNIYAIGHAMQRLGYKLLNDIAWLKPNAPPNLSCRYFTHSHETILWAAKSQKAKHTFNYELMRNHAGGKQMRSYWSLTPPAKAEKAHGKHPTQKPLTLLERIVLASTNPGDLVLDPFVGSGTTGVAAVMHRRRFIGIDSSPEYLEIAKLRLREVPVALDM